MVIGKAIEKLLGDRRGSNQYKKKEHVGNCPQAETGQKTRDIAAEKAGFGNAKTYQQAKAEVQRLNKPI